MKRLILHYLPCILMVFVGTSQICITQTEGLLTPAKGGGFGMFSTVDKGSNRQIILDALVGSERIHINIDRKSAQFKTLEPVMKNVKYYPSEAHFQKLVDQMMTWHFSSTPDAILIQVLKVNFDSDRAIVTFQLLNETSISVKKEGVF